MHQRLFEITMLLAGRGQATAAELAERFDVSVRTIYRDIDALSGAGIPVYAEQGRNGGIRLLEGYVLDKSLFSAEEQAQLMAHFQSLATLGTPDTEVLLDKLAAVFGRQGSWLQVDFAPWDGGEDTRAVFRLLRDAILRRQVVRFLYSGADGRQSVREVEPDRVIFRGQGWYLYGFSRERDAFRFFKLQRMREVQPTSQHFTSRPAAETPADLPYTGPVLHMKLWIERQTAFRVYDEFAGKQITQTPEGDFVVELDMPDGGWLTGYILSFGAGAKVLEPPELRQRIAKAAADMAALYQVEE